jgi:hypothetical protein
VTNVRVGNLLLWLVFIVALLLFVLALVGVAANVPMWALFLMIAVLAGAMLFP